MSLPVTGDLNWGVPLNTYITNAVLAVANQALTTINTHTVASDPHGDRAYAAGLVSPITTGTNLANGYVKLNGSGKLTTGMLPSGAGLSSYFDVLANYGATGNGSTDDSTALQNALNDCANAGGGEVWVGDGTFACGTQLIIGANTWLHLSPGATIKRITPISAPAPSIMVANIEFISGTGTPAAGNILISGGTWDAVGSGLSSACTPIFLVQASFSSVAQTYFKGVANNPLIELNGVTYATIRDCVFAGTALGSSSVVPAVRLNSSSTATSPANMDASVYNNAVCSEVMVAACAVVAISTYPSVGKLVGSDLYAASYTHKNVAVTGCTSPAGTYSSQPQVDFVHASGAAYGNQLSTSVAETLDLVTTGQVFVGPTVSGGSPTNVYVAGILGYATGYEGAFTAETWNTLGTLSNYNVSYGRFRLTPMGEVELDIAVNGNGSNAGTGVNFSVTLPAAYRPTGLRTFPLSSGRSVTASDPWPRVQVAASGVVTVYTAASTTSLFACTVTYPVD